MLVVAAHPRQVSLYTLYREWAETYSLLNGKLPPIEELHKLLQNTMPESQPPQTVSTVEPYREIVVKLREQGVEIAAIKQRLEERGFPGQLHGRLPFCAPVGAETA